jgi:putative FmdB family regulatory protein
VVEEFMPIYEYRCEACGHELEALQKISDSPLQTCPECNAPQLRKKISAAGFRLKGGGWYETDFKSAGKKNLAGESDKPAATKTETAAPGSSGSSGSSATGSD